MIVCCEHQSEYSQVGPRTIFQSTDREKNEKRGWLDCILKFRKCYFKIQHCDSSGNGGGLCGVELIDLEGEQARKQACAVNHTYYIHSQGKSHFLRFDIQPSQFSCACVCVCPTLSPSLLILRSHRHPLSSSPPLLLLLYLFHLTLPATLSLLFSLWEEKRYRSSRVLIVFNQAGKQSFASTA